MPLIPAGVEFGTKCKAHLLRNNQDNPDFSFQVVCPTPRNTCDVGVVQVGIIWGKWPHGPTENLCWVPQAGGYPLLVQSEHVGCTFVLPHNVSLFISEVTQLCEKKPHELLLAWRGSQQLAHPHNKLSQVCRVSSHEQELACLACF